MSQHTLKDLVTDYYAGKSLPESTVRRLEALRAPETRKRPGFSWLIAASIAVVAFGAGYLAPRMTGPATPEMSAAAVTAPPDLVAVNISADWCRRSTEVVPVFAEFAESHGNQPILFVTLDITDDASRKQADYLASTLGIEDVFEEPFGSGMIKVFDRSQGAIVATMTGRDQIREEMETLLAQVRTP